MIVVGIINQEVNVVVSVKGPLCLWNFNIWSPRCDAILEGLGVVPCCRKYVSGDRL